MVRGKLCQKLFCGRRWREIGDAVNSCGQIETRPQYMVCSGRIYSTVESTGLFRDDAHGELRADPRHELDHDLVIAGGLDRLVELDLVAVDLDPER